MINVSVSLFLAYFRKLLVLHNILMPEMKTLNEGGNLMFPRLPAWDLPSNFVQFSPIKAPDAYVQSSFVAAMSENVISSVIDYVDTGKIGSTAMDGSACAKVSIQPESVCAQYDAQGLALIINFIEFTFIRFI